MYGYGCALTRGSLEYMAKLLMYGFQSIGVVPTNDADDDDEYDESIITHTCMQQSIITVRTVLEY